MMHMQGFAQGAPPRQEMTFLSEGGVQITSSRFLVGQQMYPVAAITFVAPFSEPAKRGWPIAAICLCLFIALPGIGRGDVGATIFGVAGTALAAWWLSTRKPTHVVVVSTSGMQIRALVSQNLGFVQRVVSALNNAVASR